MSVVAGIKSDALALGLLRTQLLAFLEAVFVSRRVQIYLTGACVAYGVGADLDPPIFVAACRRLGCECVL